jgi:ATP-dependent Clp protease ATP-binding subunit ClpB
VLDVVQSHFRPEFINRLDELVVFHPLGREHIRSIARIQSGHLAKRLAERGIKLEISDSALDLIGNAGFDPVYGARPLKRTIQSQLENPLAKQILQGQFVGGDTVVVDQFNGALQFRKG